MNKYESIIVLKPSLNEDECRGIISKYTRSIEDCSHKSIKIECWGKKKLAYPVKEYSEGTYYILTFYMSETSANTLSTTFSHDSNIIKYVVVEQERDACADTNETKDFIYDLHPSKSERPDALDVLLGLAEYNN